MIDLMADKTPGSPQRDDARLATLVERCAAGDREAFGVLYDSLAPVVYGICRRVLRNDGIAADTSQEVMLELWTKSSSYAPGHGTVHAWAATVAHRRAVDWVRSESSRRDREHRSYHEPRETESVDDGLLRSDEASRVQSCLGELTALENESLSAAYYGGRTYSEVAQHLSAPLATVKSRIRSALSRLRNCMEMS